MRDDQTPVHHSIPLPWNISKKICDYVDKGIFMNKTEFCRLAIINKVLELEEKIIQRKFIL